MQNGRKKRRNERCKIGNRDDLAKSLKISVFVIPANPGSGPGQAPESSEVLAKLLKAAENRHSGQAKRDPESRIFNRFWIPAFAGMTTFYVIINRE